MHQDKRKDMNKISYFKFPDSKSYERGLAFSIHIFAFLKICSVAQSKRESKIDFWRKKRLRQEISKINKQTDKTTFLTQFCYGRCILKSEKSLFSVRICTNMRTT